MQQIAPRFTVSRLVFRSLDPSLALAANLGEPVGFTPTLSRVRLVG
jgi:hypothetical protein